MMRSLRWYMSSGKRIWPGEMEFFFAAFLKNYPNRRLGLAKADFLLFFSPF